MISQLGKVDAYLEQGKTLALTIMKAEVIEINHNIWHQEYESMSTSQQNGDTQFVCPRLNIAKKR
jgi:hypothetical protein